jgi:hypothetical protein
MRVPRVRITVRWIMARIAILAFPFLVLPHLKSWEDWGAVVVLLATYAGIEVALRTNPGASEQGYDL